MEDQPHERAWKRIYRNNKGAVLILLAEAVATSMDAIVRYLQQGGKPLHPFQIIFARMVGTAILSSLYMWWTQVPDFPLGQSKVRGLLLIRAFFGFSGLWCLYYSVHFLPLAEATVLRFLVPIVTAVACAIFLSQKLTTTDLGAGIVALIGVIIIAHPSIIFGSPEDSTNTLAVLSPSTTSKGADGVSPAMRLTAIAISLVGVLFASAAYTMIRIIGNRAHALMSVNYFAIVSIIGSTAILLLTPGIDFSAPDSAKELILQAALGVMGFILQFLLTAGLQMDKSSKATSMMYSQIVFALLFDWGIWGILPGTWSIVGGIVVMASTLWAALQKPSAAAPEKGKQKDTPPDEESPLLSDRSDD